MDPEYRRMLFRGLRRYVNPRLVSRSGIIKTGLWCLTVVLVAIVVMRGWLDVTRVKATAIRAAVQLREGK